jgi:hypothetical protein
MRTAINWRLLFGITACIVVLVFAIMWFEVPAVLEECYGPEPYSMGTCIRRPPLPVAVLKLVVELLAIAGAAVIAARGVSRFKVVAGAMAASTISLFGLAARNMVDAQIFVDVAYIRSPSTLAIVGCSFFLFGSLVAWATEHWWPLRNTRNARYAMRTLIRLVLAVVLAVTFSMILCEYAGSQAQWPQWADFCCGQNAPLMWVLTVLIAFILLRLVPALRQRRPDSDGG